MQGLYRPLCVLVVIDWRSKVLYLAQELSRRSCSFKSAESLFGLESSTMWSRQSDSSTLSGTNMGQEPNNTYREETCFCFSSLTDINFNMANNKIENLADLVNSSLEKIRKVMVKKQFELKQAVDEAAAVKDYYSANHLVRVYQLCLESKNTKLIELALFDIKNYMESNHFHQILGQRVTAEVLLEGVMSVKEEKEETVQIHMIRAIQALMTNRMHHIYGEPVPRVFLHLINVYSVTKVQAIQNAAKDACRAIVSTYFARVEEFGTLDDDEYASALQKMGQAPTHRFRMKALANADEFMNKYMLSLVDEVQLYSERMLQFEKEMERQKQNKEIDLTLIQPPLRAVSGVDIKGYLNVQVSNEKSVKNGKFGWCVVCRNAAQSYCKDTKVPVCSKECKQAHITSMSNFTQVFKQSERSEQYLKDGYEIMDMLCQHSQKEAQQPQVQPMVTRCKTISLELIYEALNHSDIIMQNKPQFLIILREHLISGLLTNSLSSEKQLLVLTMNIFVQLIWKYRSNLKKEIEAIIENVYFKFLESSNSNFDHKQFTLKVFNKILIKPQVVLELFANYDCSVGQNNLFRKMLDTQCRIIQGRYTKPEFQASVSQTQEVYLKSLCQENFCQFLKALKKYCDEQDNKALSSIQETPDEVEDTQTPMQMEQGVEKQRQMKLELNKAVQKFNFKLDRCIKQLIECGYMQDKDPKLFAQFLWENRDVNKDKLGELFGGSADFNQQVFSIYVDMMNFRQQKIDEALRNLLEYFTLPGESQEIDRIMQKFASKYVSDNPNIFNSAQAAYTLSYLLMMLQTDLHNPQNLEKMTIPQFINLAKGINDGQDMPVDELHGLYERIQKVPLALHAKEQAKRALEMANSIDQRKRHAILAKEAEQSLKKWFKDHQNQDDYFYVNSLEHVKFLLEQTWSSIFASLSVILEHSDDINQLQGCFEAIGTCVKLMGRFDSDQEKDTFLQYLQKYCAPIPSNQKQILAVNTILNIAVTSGAYLRKSWKVALQLVSRLETLHQAVNKVKGEQQREQFTFEDQQHIDRLFQQVEYTQIDKLFILSEKLDSDSILDFIRALCELSKEEIKQNKTFLLSKVVEVADYNMERIKIIWSKMWEIMRGHFLEVGCHKNVEIAIYSIDQLKQLSCKFLKQPELANYHFQKEFLIPFEQIFSHSQATQQYKTQLREYILWCMSMITNVCFNSLKSGWKIIMSIVNQALQEDQQILVKLCVQITDRIMDGPFENISEIYMELIQALIKLTKNNDLQIVLKSIDQIDILINYIANDRKKQNEKFLDQIWIPVLSSLSILYSDDRNEVQKASVNTLFQLLKQHGNKQSAEFWKIILRGVIRPLFDEMQFSKAAKSKNKQNDQTLQTCKMTFDQFTDLVVQQIQQMQPCLNDLTEIYVQLVLQTQDNVSVLCLESLNTIIHQAGAYFQEENWTSIIEQLQHLINQCSPRELLEAFNLDEDFQKPLDDLLKEDIKHKKFAFKLNGFECQNKQAIQQKCLEVLRTQVQFYQQSLTQAQLQCLRGVFRDEHNKCKKYNQHLYMRYFLQRQAESQLPSFLKTEFMAARALLHLIEDKQEFVNGLFERCMKGYEESRMKFQLKDDINSQLLYQRQSESVLVIKECQALLMEVFPSLVHLQDKRELSKRVLKLLRTSGAENADFFQAQVDLLEQIIELN